MLKTTQEVNGRLRKAIVNGWLFHGKYKILTGKQKKNRRNVNVFGYG